MIQAQFKDIADIAKKFHDVVDSLAPLGPWHLCHPTMIPSRDV